MRVLNTDYSSKINSNVQQFFHNWKTNMWSSDYIDMNSAIREVSKREMKNGTWREEWEKEEDATQLSSPKNDPEEQLLSILKCEKNSSHIHVKTAIVLSLSCLNIRFTFV